MAVSDPKAPSTRALIRMIPLSMSSKYPVRLQDSADRTQLGRVATTLKKRCLLPVYLTIATALLLVSIVAESTPAWSSQTTVTKVIIDGQGRPQAAFVDSINDGSATGGGYKILELTHTGVDQIYAMMLAAITSGQELRYYVDGCVGNYPRITKVEIFPAS